MSLLAGKRGLIVGVANDRSYATFIAKQILAHGGECLFTHLPGDKMEKRCRSAVEKLGVSDPWLEPLDASSDENLDAVFAKLAADFGQLDFLVHSIAFADRQYLEMGKFQQTSRQAWSQAMEISAYSLLAMSRRAAPLMTGGGSILAMTYYGGEKVVPGYNVMGVAKAALEHTARYLASELGEQAIRVNTISGGPLRTLAASAVGGIGEMFDMQERTSPLRRNITGEEVGDAAVYLISDLATAVTGETLHIDAGYSIMGGVKQGG